MDCPFSIEKLLAARGASLKGEGGDTAGAAERRDLTRLICDDYPAFEEFRNAIMDSKSGIELARLQGRTEKRLVEAMLDVGIATSQDGQIAVGGPFPRRYLSGSWLEELAWLASFEAGAEEANFSQELSWQVNDFYGENEIDLIVRRKDRLGFVSCKALQSEFRVDNRKHRNRLMDAVHEANNLVDHFGVPGEKAAVLVTSDLIDESRGAARYAALMGKAAVLDVRIIPLEELRWHKLVNALKDVVEGRVIDHSLDTKLKAGED